ncbi:unnamed protein product [Parascedosporium putredinis]|uniref:Alpha/beta hydrolase fold-3 domain-containing protein n=1 Tax=Parascedosporium putredinis TaxID=1442378 RepID=A0A9P1HCI1_9PEZI|nr:unnamed protein product [Parascedosporium putredinis]CAI8004743.1 unnamed protein product [Parascedosporium putredinis]
MEQHHPDYQTVELTPGPHFIRPRRQLRRPLRRRRPRCRRPLRHPLYWPTPVHDVAFAYHWLSTNLAPPGLTRRDILVLSSHLGASLATSLALTESRPHLPFAVRGLAVLNGIYSWPMFLPDHRAHRKSPPRSRSRAAAARRTLLAHAAEEDDLEQRGTVLAGSTVSYQGCDQLARFAALMPGLFGHRPARLFDVFASPALMFQTPGINVPSSFTRSDTLASQIDWLASTQALEFAALMRRSVEKLEVKERREWDFDFDEDGDLPEKRVRVLGVDDADDPAWGLTAEPPRTLSRRG